MCRWSLPCACALMNPPRVKLLSSRKQKEGLVRFNPSVYARERDFQAVCAVRRSQCSSSLYPAHNSQPENSVSDVMSWLLKSPGCSFLFLFFCHSIGLAWLTNQLLFTCKKKIKQPHPTPLSFCCAFKGIKLSPSAFLLGLYQRCPRRLAHNRIRKQVSWL